jgi:hypothetical protein
MEESLLQSWNRRVVTRGGFVVVMAVVPVIVAALISLGGGVGVLPEGLGSLTNGPSEQATGVNFAATKSSAPGALVALASPAGALSRGGASVAAPGPGNGTGSPAAAAPPGSGGGGTRNATRPQGASPVGGGPSQSPGPCTNCPGPALALPSADGVGPPPNKGADPADVAGMLNAAAKQVNGVSRAH